MHYVPNTYTYSLIISYSTGPHARIKARREVFQRVGILPGAVLFVIVLVELILRARTRVFEGFAYSETRKILLPTTDH